VFVAADRHREIIAQYFRWEPPGPARHRFVAARSASRTPGSRRRSSGPRPATPCPPRSSTRPCPRSRAGDPQRGDEGLQRLQLDLLNKVKAGEVRARRPRSGSRSSGSGRCAGRGRGDVEHGSLMAGQSVAFVKKIQPVREISTTGDGRRGALARMAGEGDVPDHSAGPGVLRSLQKAAANIVEGGAAQGSSRAVPTTCGKRVRRSRR